MVIHQLGWTERSLHKAVAITLAALILVVGHGRGARAQQWLVDANNRIEQHRKADLTVNVVDSQGNQVPGANVHVAMKRHSFRFGTAVTAGWINNNSPVGQMYKEKLLENFNEVVFENDLKWPPWEGLWGGGFNWPNTEQALDWLDANNLPARGHYLSWATWSGSDAYGTSHSSANVPQNVVNTVPQRLLDHISEKVNTVGTRVYEWDAINHPVGWLNDTYENRYGLEFYSQIIDHARSQAPAGMPMWINEDDVIAGNSRADDYERIIEDMIARGSAPDGIGFQAHFVEEWGRLNFFNRQPQTVYDRIDRFDELVDRLRVTEFDIDVGNDEAWQGELMHDFLTVMFSHPNMEAITMWGFWAGSHWRPDAALYRNDWSEKPALTAYQDLVFEDWWTDEAGTSSSEGEYATRGFKGLYDVTVTIDRQEYLLSDLQLEDDTDVEFVVDIGTLLGDYNENGVVDASDYTVWRDNLGANLILPNEDTSVTPGMVTAEDYIVWKGQFTKAASGVSNFKNAASPVPEVSTQTLIGLAALLGLVFRRNPTSTAKLRSMAHVA